MDVRSFFGIIPPKISYTEITSPVEEIPLPEKVTILWPGKPPSALKVSIGEDVKTGQNLAKKKDTVFISTVTGQVEEIFTLPGLGRREDLAITIRTAGQDSYETPLEPVEDFSKFKPFELRTFIMQAGFDALSRISNIPAVWPKVECLLISAMDQDPLCCSNGQALKFNGEHLLDALELLSMATEAERCVLAMPQGLNHQLPEGLSTKCTVSAVPPIYPNGLEEMLAKNYGAGHLMEARGSGVRGNTLVIGIEYALSMAASLRQGRPFVEKIVTVSGKGNGLLKSYLVRIGTPISRLLQEAGLEIGSGGKLIVNGLMRGYSCFSAQQPITSYTHSVHVQDAQEVYLYHDTQCINCGKCDSICPVDLAVSLLGRFAEHGRFEDCWALGVENCIYCGLCAYICPAKRPLVHYINNAKYAIEQERATGFA